MEYLILFAASFGNVFLLALNSQIIRDRLIAIAFCLSWGISTGQFFFTRIVANAEDPLYAFLASGFGGSFGVVSSIMFYDWFSNKTELGRKIWKR